MNSQIFISGGGNEDQTFEFDQLFFNSLKKSANLLYIPIALRDSDLYLLASEWFSQLLEIQTRTDINVTKLNDFYSVVAEDLEKFDAIYIGGGNTWLLMNEIMKSEFDVKLRKYLEGKKVLYGGSAGAIILGKNISLQNDENTVGYDSYDGLNLLQDFSVACHFDNEQVDLYQKLADEYKTKLICLPEESGAIIDLDSAQYFGDSFLIFNK